ncbi:MAG TPA: V-type ATP synthase subunit E family protein [Anaerolineales bacterium]|nr:V-type ATP synthase subunit E family protein [Anaerolineales bacterium]
MSLQTILETIRTAGEAQVGEIERNAGSEGKAILAQARMEGQQIEEHASADASMPAIPERARILHRARLDALYSVGSIREGLVDTALAHTRERLASLRSDSTYPAILRRLLEESLVQLESTNEEGRPQLLADPRDEELLEMILDELQLNMAVTYELNCWGGLVARSADGRVVVINTFESRLEHATAFLRHSLAVLFEEEQSTMEDMVHA